MAQEVIVKGTKKAGYYDNNLAANRTIGGATWTALSIGFRATDIPIRNRETAGGNYLEWSFDGGTTIAGRLYAGESFNDKHDGVSTIYIRSLSANIAYGLWVR
jgi:hypothetical protein